jgi:hypothetical protein
MQKIGKFGDFQFLFLVEKFRKLFSFWSSPYFCFEIGLESFKQNTVAKTKLLC